MAAGNTYEVIDTQTLGSAAASVTFSSIPSTYTDLVIIVAGIATSGTNNCRYYYNGDNSSGLYSRTSLSGNGTSAVSGRSTASNYNFAAYATTTQGVNIINIFNYANTNVFKTSIIRGGTADDSTITRVNLWRNTNAISSITVDTDGSTWVAGTVFSLYGIAAATIPSGAKATGGEIFSDATYMYHVFGASDVFRPTQSLTADVLVVAGGGAAGYGGAGGAGGAGGLSYQAGKSLANATSYTITVGAGGAGNQTNPSRGASGSNSTFDTIISNGGGGGGGGGAASGLHTPSSGGSGASGSGDGAAGTLLAGSAATQGNTGGATGYGFAGGGTRGRAEFGWGAVGGGGGAGAAGETGIGTAVGNQQGGNGGIGLNTWASWATATGTGDGGYYAGGGAGYGSGANSVGNPRTRGLGGGGASGVSGYTNTGGGAGGGSGSSGGSGIVIVRYTK